MADLESLKGSNNGGNAPQGENTPGHSLPGEGNPPSGPKPNLPGDAPQPTNPEIPASWYDLTLVLARILEISRLDAPTAIEMWKEYKRLTGRL